MRPDNYSTSNDYELLVRKLIEQDMTGISGVKNFEILHNQRIRGLSGYEHQIDVAYKFRLWKTDIFVIVECKQYRKKVGVDDLLEFRARVEDLRAHKGVFVASSGFQSGAFEFAEANGIALLIVRGTKRVKKSIDVLFQDDSTERLYEKQYFELSQAYQLTNTEPRLSINKRKGVVVAAHKRARIAVKPQELHFSSDDDECQLEERDTDDVFFSAVSRLKKGLRTDKVMKFLLLDKVLSLTLDGIPQP